MKKLFLLMITVIGLLTACNHTSPTPSNVFVCYGHYHKSNECKGIRRCKEDGIEEMAIQDAINDHKRPCRICYPVSIEEFEEDMDTKLAHIESEVDRLDDIESKLDKIEDRLDNIESHER